MIRKQYVPNLEGRSFCRGVPFLGGLLVITSGVELADSLFFDLDFCCLKAAKIKSVIHARNPKIAIATADARKSSMPSINAK